MNTIALTLRTNNATATMAVIAGTNPTPAFVRDDEDADGGFCWSTTIFCPEIGDDIGKGDFSSFCASASCVLMNILLAVLVDLLFS